MLFAPIYLQQPVSPVATRITLIAEILTIAIGVISLVTTLIRFVETSRKLKKANETTSILRKTTQELKEELAKAKSEITALTERLSCMPRSLCGEILGLEHSTAAQGANAHLQMLQNAIDQTLEQQRVEPSFPASQIIPSKWIQEALTPVIQDHRPRYGQGPLKGDKSELDMTETLAIECYARAVIGLNPAGIQSAIQHLKDWLRSGAGREHRRKESARALLPSLLKAHRQSRELIEEYKKLIDTSEQDLAFGLINCLDELKLDSADLLDIVREAIEVVVHKWHGLSVVLLGQIRETLENNRLSADDIAKLRSTIAATIRQNEPRILERGLNKVYRDLTQILCLIDEGRRWRPINRCIVQPKRLDAILECNSAAITVSVEDFTFANGLGTHGLWLTSDREIQQLNGAPLPAELTVNAIHLGVGTKAFPVSINKVKSITGNRNRHNFGYGLKFAALSPEDQVFLGALAEQFTLRR